VIHYRTFRNTDPPLLVDLWNRSCTGRASAFLSGANLLEYFVFAKPYFDPQGMIFACSDNAGVPAGPVGFVHAGFLANVQGTALDRTQGMVSLLAVQPSHRHQGIGAELLRRAEAYLLQAGAKVVTAGPQGWNNPFAFGLYGGSQTPGYLDSDASARPFLEKKGYQLHSSWLVMQRPLDRPVRVADGRLAGLRQRFEIHVGPRRGATWWQECVLGPLELQEFSLVERTTQQTVARLTLWELDTYARRWNEQVMGVVELEVEPALRRQGVGRFHLAQVLRYLQDQLFNQVEVQIPEDNRAALDLVRSLGFDQVDVGRSFRRTGGG